MDFTRILCPVDFSPYSKEALRVASDLAMRFDGTLSILHVIPPIPVSAVPGAATAFNVAEYQQQLVGDNTAALTALVSEVLPLSLSEMRARSQTIVLHGEPAFEIVRYAQEIRATLIVLATRGLTGWDHVLFGSVAERVVRLSPCPVLTIRGGPPSGNRAVSSNP